MKSNLLRQFVMPPCSKCPYKLGLIHTVRNPCPQCKHNNYHTYKRFLEQVPQIQENN